MTNHSKKNLRLVIFSSSSFPLLHRRCVLLLSDNSICAWYAPTLSKDIHEVILQTCDWSTSESQDFSEWKAWQQTNLLGISIYHQAFETQSSKISSINPLFRSCVFMKVQSACPLPIDANMIFKMVNLSQCFDFVRHPSSRLVLLNHDTGSQLPWWLLNK